MTLSENGFAILDVAPSDDRRTLTEKADEAALLSGEDAEEAFHQLMQMSRRIPAEISWFPGSTRQAADAFLAYSRQVKEGHPAVIPDMDGLGTALAQANALNALFEIWPSDDPELFVGMCRAMDGIISHIKEEEVLEALNRDREAGKWEKILDIQEIEEPLNVHLRDLCQPAARGAESMDTEMLSAALLRLFRSRGFDLQGSVAQAVSAVYSVRIHEKAESMKSEIRTETERLSKNSGISQAELMRLKMKIDKWCKLTAPLRIAPGTIRNDSRTIGFGMRGIIVDFTNNAPTSRKQKKFVINMVAQTRTVTITYHSKTVYVEKALEITKWMIQTFSEHIDLVERLHEDEKQLKKMISDEKEMLEKAEAQERAKYRF